MYPCGPAECARRSNNHKEDLVVTIVDVMVKGGANDITTLIDHKILCIITIKIWTSEIDVVTVTTSIYKIKLKK